MKLIISPQESYSNEQLLTMGEKAMRLFFLLSLLVIAGCATTTTYYLGAQEKPERIAQIPPLPTETLRWEDLYIKVDYQLSQKDGVLKISGRLAFADYPRINLARFEQMVLSVYLLDEQGRVVNYAELIKPLGSSFDEQFPFEKQLSLPSTASALSFGYDIRTYDETGAGSFYWQHPLRTP
jgi:hypothetical protein